jgi:hypothetical protein
MEAALTSSAPADGSPARIVHVVTRRSDGAASTHFRIDEAMALQVTVEAVGRLNGLVVGVQVRDTFDRVIWGTRSDWHLGRQLRLEAGQRTTIAFLSEHLLLGPGLYQVTVAIHEQADGDRIWQWVDEAWRFEVVALAESRFIGVVDLGWQCVESGSSVGPNLRAS